MLPQPLYLFATVTRSLHFHFGSFIDTGEPVTQALDRLSEQCMRHMPPRSRVLDVGCALGGTSALLSRAGFDVVGIDPCPATIDYARARATPGPGAIEFLAVGLEEYARDATPRSFDSLVMIEVSQHFRDLACAFEACRNLLAPGGTLVVSDVTKVAVDLPWAGVPFHRVGELGAAARVAGLDVVESTDLTDRVVPTLPRILGMVSAQRDQLIETLVRSRLQVAADLEELVRQMQLLQSGFEGGNLIYELTVMRRPDLSHRTDPK